MRNYIFLLFIMVLGASCVPAKKVMYLQNNELDAHNVSHDSVLLSHIIRDIEYKLAPGDILSVEISSITPKKFDFLNQQEKDRSEVDPRLSGYLIGDDGIVEIPFVGSLKVGGLTLKEATSLIKERAASLLNEPSVNVKMLNYSYTILGEVGKPGVYYNYNSKVNIFEAIAQAGDLTDFANRSQIKLIREENGDAQIIMLNLLQDDFLGSPYYYLKPGDFIYAPPMKVKNFKQYQLPNAAVLLSTLTVLGLVLIRLN